ncbi:MAG: hypothetical protein QXN71_02350 [Candidatus Aenigmatarchaeota archaeon]
MNKILLGVGHKSEQELEKVKGRIDIYIPSIAGIELPEDYMEKEDIGYTIFFFSDITSYLKDKGTKVIPLEDSATVDYHYAIEVAKAVYEGKITRRQVEIEEAEVRNMKITPYMSPELIRDIEFLVNRYKNILDILNNTKGLEDVMKLWKSSNKKREVHMLEKIKKYMPDLVIIGDGHARELKDNLPEYNYERSFEL